MSPARSISLLLGLVVLLALPTANAFADPPEKAHVPDRVIIKFKQDVPDQEKNRILSDMRATKLKDFKRIRGSLERIEGLTVGEAIGRYRNHPAVDFIEPDYVVEALEIPNDPRFDDLWGMRNVGQTGGTAGADIMAENAWDVFTGSENVVIGVIDTGVDYNHPDLAANIWTNPGEIPGNGVDDDGNGFIDDVHGWDFVNDDNDPMDDNGHGTHCSGTIGGVGNNGIGVAGVNWDVKIMGLKFLSAGGSGSTSDAIECIEYATMMGVQLTSNSWGGGGYSEALRQAIADAQAAGILFVAAAGNSSSNNDVSPHYPSNYDLDNVVSVAATDHNDELASFSSYGATTVDLAAPGVDILSTVPGSSYGYLSGTSMATPHVAGALGLVFGRFPAISGADAKNLLLNFVDPIPDLEGVVLTGGRLNAFFPIADPDTIPPGQVTDLVVSTTGSNWADLEWSAVGDDGYTGTASRYDLRWSTSPIDDSNFADATRVMGTPDPDAPGTPQAMRVDGLDFNTTYYFAVKALDEFGNPGDLSNVPAGTTLGIPIASVSPSSLSEALLTGGTAMQTLTLSNVGEGTLDFNAPIPVLLGAPSTVFAAEFYAKGETDPRVGDPVLQGTGGPDAFGYRWFDSNDPFGPTFEWTDISGVGTAALTTGDDVSAGPLPIGFDFPFYGGEFGEFYINSNGALSLTSSDSPYSNQPLPSGGAPPHLIAPFWDDLVVGSGAVYYHYDGTRLIVQFDGVDHYGSGGPYTFQVHLWPDGTIDYHYLDMSDPLASATVGIQNGDGTDGLTVAFNTAYVENELAVRIRAVPQWMTVSPSEGTVFAGGSMSLDVHFDAEGLLGGDYDGIVRILSNDPATPSLEVPVSLAVTGAPDLSVEPASVDFGGTFLGATPTAAVTLRNTGTDLLTISSLSVDEAAFSLDLSAPLSLAPRQAQDLIVTFAPTAAQPYAGTLTVQSDDPDEPMQTVSLAGLGQEPPDFSVDPASLYADLMTGGSSLQNLTITNSGGADFVFDLTVETDAQVTVHESPDLAKDEVDTRVGAPVTAGAGGPDNYGYQWIDSDEPGGPAYVWEDISATGTPVFTSDADEENAGPLPIGFSFPFYGTDFTEIRVSSNGWISFTDTSTDYSNDPLPATGAPENLLAVWWDDLDVELGEGGNVFYLNDGNRFIVQYDSVNRFFTGGPYTFQVILYPNGDILYQYESMQGTRLDEATIGIQNADGTDGLTVAFNTDYVHDGLAIRFSAAPEWLTVTPTQGTVPPGGSMVLDVAFNAEGLFGGFYEASIDFTTNDPAAESFSVPATMDVTGAPDLQVSAEMVDFGPVMIGYPSLKNLTLFNQGTDVLTISGYNIANTDFQVNLTPPVNLAPMSQLLLDVRFAPSGVGSAEAVFTIESNDPDMSAMDVQLLGEGIEAPVAGVDPTSVAADLLTGQQALRTAILSNTGGSDLVYTTQAVVAATEVVVAESPDLGKDQEDPRLGFLGTGGPDLFGYRWIDSDEPGGPAFDWVEISDVGTPVWTSDADDRNAGPISIGFSFPFYGQDFAELRISSNGWLSFTNTSTDLSNDPLPATGAPENMLAVFWDDLVVDMDIGGNVYTYNDGNRFIVQYDNVRRYGSGGPYTFQALLYPNGTIVYQYLSMQGDRLDEATLGIQNAARDDGLTVVYNDAYVHDNLAVRIGTTPQWLTVSPAEGTLGPGESRTLQISLDATGLFGGDYQGAVQILSNDPARGLLEVAANLHVTGVPDIATEPTSLDFGEVYIGVTEDLTLTVMNAGTDLLSISGVSTNHSDYTVPTAGFDLDPLSSMDLPVSFAPTSEGEIPAELTLLSNDPDQPSLVVPLAGIGVDPPVMAMSPTTMEAAAMPGRTKVKTLQICNEGGSDLNFTVNAGETQGTTVTTYPYLEVGKEEEDPRPGILGSGGPDAFGYTWVDSDDPGGPTYDWVDISGIGTPVFGAYRDDGNEGPFPIGFSFPFYGETFDQFRVATNGFLSFTSSSSSYSNQPIPNSGAPENLLAVFWDDMVVDPTDGGEIFYHYDGTKLIVQFEVRRIAQFSPPYYSFQALLYPDGEIVYQYQGLGSNTTSATIGIQNGDRDDGLMVVYNDDYVHEDLAIRFSSAAAWLVVEPTSGTVAPGECMELQVTLNATDMEPGDYEGSIDLTSNDIVHPVVSCPVLFHVGVIDAAWADVDPNTLNLDSNGKTIAGMFQLPVEYDPAMIVPETVTFMEQVPALERPWSVSEDHDEDGIADAMFKFDRAEVEAILPEGEMVEVVIYGEIQDTMWFAAKDTIRVIRPRMMTPNGEEQLYAGGNVTVQWEDPEGFAVESATLAYSPDAGTTWTVLAENLTGNSYQWTTPVEPTTEGLLRVFVYDDRGAMGYDTSDGVFSVGSATGVDLPQVPRAFALKQNHPNPFNPRTSIRFDLPQAARVELTIYDARGRQVRRLVSREMPAGYHEVSWMGRDDQGRQVASGVYHYLLQAGDQTARKRMVLVK